jgi:hypothetical protein
MYNCKVTAYNNIFTYERIEIKIVYERETTLHIYNS